MSKKKNKNKKEKEYKKSKKATKGSPDIFTLTLSKNALEEFFHRLPLYIVLVIWIFVSVCALSVDITKFVNWFVNIIGI